MDPILPCPSLHSDVDTIVSARKEILQLRIDNFFMQTLL